MTFLIDNHITQISHIERNQCRLEAGQFCHNILYLSNQRKNFRNYYSKVECHVLYVNYFPSHMYYKVWAIKVLDQKTAMF